MTEISKEKKDWMIEIGMREFEKPMKYYLGENCVYSVDYIANTPLEELKMLHDERLIRQGEVFTNNKDLNIR